MDALNTSNPGMVDTEADKRKQAYAKGVFGSMTKPTDGQNFKNDAGTFYGGGNSVATVAKQVLGAYLGGRKPMTAGTGINSSTPMDYSSGNFGTPQAGV